MSEHVHQHVPEELQEPWHADAGRERIFEILAIALLSAAAIGTAWSGYQAARWSGREAHNFALADTLHAKSTRSVIRAGEDRFGTSPTSSGGSISRRRAPPMSRRLCRDDAKRPDE